MNVNDGMVERLRAIGHPQRLSLLHALSRGECGVGELARITGIGQPALSQQLAVLRGVGLIDGRREAKQVFYSINPVTMRDAAASIEALAPALEQASRKCAKTG